MGKKFSSKIGPAVSLILVFVITFIMFGHINDPRIFILISQLGLLAPLALILLFAILAPTPVTAEGLAILGGLLFGPFWGSIVNVFGLFASSMVEYYIGIRLSKTQTARSLKKKFSFTSPWFLILGKFLPWQGAKLVNLAAGAYKISLSTQIWTSLVASIPGAFLWGYGGNRLILTLKSLF